MDLDRSELMRLGPQEMPPEIVGVRVKWIDPPANVDWNQARAELKRLLVTSVPPGDSQDASVITLADRAQDYPTLAKVAEAAVISYESTLGKDLRTIAERYKAAGGQQLSREELERDLAERRGAA